MIAANVLPVPELLPPVGGSSARAGVLRAYQAPRKPFSASVPGRQSKESNRRHVLVVDDDPDLLELISMTIERAGFTADRARNGEEAWTAVCNASYDLVITDNQMPLMSGVKLIARLRSVARAQPCLLISGSTAELDSLRRHIAPGAVLAKPFSSMELLEHVYTLLLRGGEEYS